MNLPPKQKPFPFVFFVFFFFASGKCMWKTDNSVKNLGSGNQLLQCTFNKN